MFFVQATDPSKVCELITHIKRFEGTETLVKDFGLIADILGERMGCFLFQLLPGYRVKDETERNSGAIRSRAFRMLFSPSISALNSVTRFSKRARSAFTSPTSSLTDRSHLNDTSISLPNVARIATRSR